MSPFVAEIIGTSMILLFGCGVVAGVLLDKSKSNGGGWIVITFAWAIGVTLSQMHSGSGLPQRGHGTCPRGIAASASWSRRPFPAAWAGRGIVPIAPHAGHLARWPPVPSAASRVFPHWHLYRMGIIHSFPCAFRTWSVSRPLAGPA